MKILDMQQGSPEWHYARLGIPTASQADRILTPSKLKPATAAQLYRFELLAEWVLGSPLEWGHTGFTERGKDLEAEARTAYELEIGADVERVGLVLTDDGMFGGSPDGLIGSEGGLEIKCPAIHTHVGYLLEPEALAAEYRGQVQALLWLTGRSWWDLWSYNPELPPVRVRVEPDADWQAAWEKVLPAFLDTLRAGRERLAPYRRTPHLEALRQARETEAAGDLSVLLAG